MIRGTISAAWTIERGSFSLCVSVPPGTTTTAWIPANEVSRVTEDGRLATQAPGVRLLRLEEGWALFEVEFGSCVFMARAQSHPVSA
jgi:alpha-L-rhamnosidase